MTRYVAIAFGRNPPMPSPEDWRPWVESKADDAIFIPLVLNHALRMRGGVLHLNGLFRHGYLMAPILAQMAAGFLLDGIIPELMDEDRS